MRSDRILLAVAIVSVGLNLLLAGVLLGQRAGPDRAARHLDPMIGVRRVFTDLPEARTAALTPHFRQYFSALRPRFREIRSTQQDLRDAMLTEPLDEAALTEALAAFQARFSASQRAARDAFVALASAMTLEERRQLLAAMSGPPHPGPGFHSERPPHDHAPAAEPGIPLPP